MKNKLLALKLLKQKIHDPSLTFPLISEKTGYSKRQLIRLSHFLDESSDMEALYHHANEGKEPVNIWYKLMPHLARVFLLATPPVICTSFYESYCWWLPMFSKIFFDFARSDSFNSTDPFIGFNPFVEASCYPGSGSLLTVVISPSLPISCGSSVLRYVFTTSLSLRYEHSPSPVNLMLELAGPLLHSHYRNFIVLLLKIMGFLHLQNFTE